MSTQAAFKAEADACGIEYTYERGFMHPRTGAPVAFSIMLDAPEGKVFCSSGCHCDASIRGDDGTTRTDWAQALRALRAIVELGVEDCDDPACDICHPVDEEGLQ